MTITDLAIIVPVGPKDLTWSVLAKELDLYAKDAEKILVCCEKSEQLESLARELRFKILYCEKGRAKQLNLGANTASRKWLWFLHCDSRINYKTVRKLASCIETKSDALFFSRLKFYDGNHLLMWLTTLGVIFRSEILKIPFGDQGFCLTKDSFLRLGKFDKECVYGEDHLLLWKARKAGLEILHTGGVVKTSARKYKEQGWLATTMRHLFMTLKQILEVNL